MRSPDLSEPTTFTIFQRAKNLPMDSADPSSSDRDRRNLPPVRMDSGDPDHGHAGSLDYPFLWRISMDNDSAILREDATPPLLSDAPPTRESTLDITQSQASHESQRVNLPSVLENDTGKHKDKAGYLFPLTVTVRQRRTLNGEDDAHYEPEDVQFKWTEANTADSYKLLAPQKEEVKKPQAAAGKQDIQTMYCRYGSCKIGSRDGYDYGMRTYVIEDHTQLGRRAVQMIAAYISKTLCLNHQPSRDLWLYVHWHYGWARINNPPQAQLGPSDHSPSYSAMIRKEMQRKMQVNFLGQEYIPRPDLDYLLQDDVIDQILETDKPPNLNRKEMKEFVQEIKTRCRKLFAICVFREIRMENLYHLVNDHRCGDSPDKRPRRQMLCQSVLCEDEFLGSIFTAEPKFFAKEIVFDFQHMTLDYDDVLPLHSSNSQGARNQPEIIGQGASGTVFALVLEVGHNLPEVSNSHPALKDNSCRLAVKKISSKELFDKESKTLKTLAEHPHDHFVQYLKSWERPNDEFYILYPRAECDLKSYLKDHAHPNLSASTVLWFVGQIKGLASGIHHLHHFKIPSIVNPDPDSALWGRHNDLKPANILVFKNAANGREIFKIADFGLSVLHEARGSHSQHDTEMVGTETNRPPDKSFGRAFDMWALGCSFLELVLWLFAFYHGDNPRGDSPQGESPRDEKHRTFSTDRISFPGRESTITNTKFWYKVESQQDVFELKPGVRNAISELKTKHCVGMRAFQDILLVIEQLLDVNSETRMKSKALVLKLDQVWEATRAELEGPGGTPDLYARILQQNREKIDSSSDSPVVAIDFNIPPA